MTTNDQSDDTIVETWNGRIKLRFKVRGSGPPLVYFPPEGGLSWDHFLIGLSDNYTIYAPELPGTSVADSMAIHQIDDIFDLVLAYESALRSLGLTGAPAIGASFGGMLAAELASCFSGLFGKVALIAAAGLWSENHVWTLDYMSAMPHELPGLLFADPGCEGARTMFAPPASAEKGLEHAIATIWSLGCAAKFLWPIPDRGLSKRLHRVTAPTLILWGEDDRVIPAVYAEEFGKRISGSRVEILQSCGHIPQLEQPAAVFSKVSSFLASA